jgi:DNA adenine methylase
MIFRPNMQHRIYRTAKPFVKWVGGKTQLLGDIERTLPSDFSQKKNVIYVEPFVGGGAVLFWILQQFPNIQKAVINDINPHLITTYKVIKEQPYKLIEQLKEVCSSIYSMLHIWSKYHSSNGKDSESLQVVRIY